MSRAGRCTPTRARPSSCGRSGRCARAHALQIVGPDLQTLHSVDSQAHVVVATSYGVATGRQGQVFRYTERLEPIGGPVRAPEAFHGSWGDPGAIANHGGRLFASIEHLTGPRDRQRQDAGYVTLDWEGADEASEPVLLSAQARNHGQVQAFAERGDGALVVAWTECCEGARFDEQTLLVQTVACP